ncbi:hypothetical protein BJ170DRAFT_680380 [Xylariales sp. AK1849]|nr:hypothetical protein BJ170DRAFT_680380 [Xylariales sp. AK1849]
MPQAQQADEEDATTSCCGALSCYALRKPVEVSKGNDFWTWPWFGPLVFENQSSDARDHCANERIYMAIVAVAIVLSFHLKSQPSAIELRMARPLGIIFWFLALSCLLVGFCNYMQTVNKYSRKIAIVQTGWRTQSIMSLVALAIVGTCLVLLVITKLQVEG